MPKNFTLKTAIVPRETKEDLKKRRATIVRNRKTPYWHNNSSPQGDLYSQ